MVSHMLESGKSRVGILLKSAVGIELVSPVNGVKGFLICFLRTVVYILTEVFEFIPGKKFQPAFAAGRQHFVREFVGKAGDHLTEPFLSDKGVVGQFLELAADRL